MTVRCEGYHKTGGAFSLGPVTWKQCSNAAIVDLTFVQDSKTETLPSCSDCWREAIDSNAIEIQDVNIITINAKENR